MTAVLAGLAVGLSAGLGPRYPHIDGSGLRTGLEVAIANTIAVGLAFGFVRAAYGKYALARWWLACRGDLRWRLMAFLLGGAWRVTGWASSVPGRDTAAP
jgi:hypothetical protein